MNSIYMMNIDMRNVQVSFDLWKPQLREIWKNYEHPIFFANGCPKLPAQERAPSKVSVISFKTQEMPFNYSNKQFANAVNLSSKTFDSQARSSCAVVWSQLTGSMGSSSSTPLDGIVNDSQYIISKISLHDLFSVLTLPQNPLLKLSLKSA